METPYSVKRKRTDDPQQARPPLRAHVDDERRTADQSAAADEVSKEETHRPPRWVPYAPPPPGRWTRLRRAFGRYGFAVLCLLLAAGLVAFLQILPQQHSGPGAAGQGAPAEDWRGGRAARAMRPSAATAKEDPYEGLAYLRISTRPSGATVVLGRDTLGTTPLQSVAVPAGVHVLSLYTSAGAPVDTVITLKQGATPHLTFTLSPLLAANNSQPAARNPQPAPAEPEPTPSPAQPRSDPPASSPTRTQPTQTQPTQTQPTRTQPTRTQTGAVRLTSVPSGATVLIDGQRVGTTPMTAPEVAAGMHTVTFRMEGFAPDQANVVRVTPGQQKLVHGELTLQRGTLHVLARPWGSIYIDGDLKERSTDLWHTMRLPPGSHSIKVVHPSLGVKTYVVQLTPGEEQSVVLDLTK